MCYGRPEWHSLSMWLCQASKHLKKMILLFIGSKLETLTADKENPLTSIQDCVGKLQCNPPSESCCLGQFTECGIDDDLKSILEDIHTYMMKT